MKYSPFYLILILTLVSGGLWAQENPYVYDYVAKEKFRNTHFFTNGRGMHMSPGLITQFHKVMDSNLAPDGSRLDIRTWLKARWGLNLYEDQVVGLFDVDYKGLRVGAIGCVACHSGKAAGHFIVGLGNKNIDVVQMAKDVHRIEKWWKFFTPNSRKSQDYIDVEESALAFSRYLADERIGNLSQGMVPISFIRGWFYRIHNEDIPKDLKRGQVKIPMLWGYEEKRKAGLFCDGYGDGDEIGWAVAVEIAAGQTPETIREIYDDAHAAEELFNDFLPPPYPFEVDELLAQRGKEIFSQTCAKCHGTYERDDQGIPIFKQPKYIPWEVVKTDKDRIEGNTPEFNRKVEESPLNDIIRYTQLGQGYFAPRLDGVWARFPYLHNGSVPNIRMLLEAPENRPKYFSLADAGERYRFSEKNLGLTTAETAYENRSLLFDAKRGVRSVYYTEREGHSNQGHNFFTSLSTGEKDAIIEYLKTL